MELVIFHQSIIQYIGWDTTLVIKNPNDFKSLDRLIIPGVGAAKQCIDNLKRKKYFEEIFKFYKTGKPLLGICLGMQIFGKTYLSMEKAMVLA